MSFNKAARELHGQVLLGSIIGEAATKMCVSQDIVAYRAFALHFVLVSRFVA